MEENRLIARRSEFRLISESQGCALFSRQEKLPSWGFKQQEVLCMKDAKKAKTIWRIESTQSELCKPFVFFLFFYLVLAHHTNLYYNSVRR